MPELKEASLSEIAEQYHLSVERLITEMEKLTDQNGMPRYSVLEKEIPCTSQKLKDALAIAAKIGITPMTMPPLGRDYVVLTQSALRNQALEKVVELFRRVRSRLRLNNQIVIQEKGLETLKELVLENPELQANIDALEKLRQNKMLCFVDGEIYEEDIRLWNFIHSNASRQASIVVVGRNTVLHHKITAYNHWLRRNHQEVKRLKIYERGIEVSTGHMINPEDIPNFFYPANGKLPAPYSNCMLNYAEDTPDCPGQYVYDAEGMPIKLEKIISQGAEGIIFQIDARKCIKILKSVSLTELKLKKIELMISAYPVMYDQDPYIMDRIAWPEKMVYNDRRQPVGFIMRFFPDVEMFANFSYGTFPDLIPGVNKRHQVRMAKNFAEIISFIHSNSIVLCDMNRRNILFNCKTQQAYLVDLDSAQVADEKYYYPARVGTEQLLSPEHIEPQRILGYDEPQVIYDFLHTPADDVWAMQMTLFQIVTPCQNPYRVAKLPKFDWELVRKGMYPYQCKEHGQDNLFGGYNGDLHIMFSHIPQFLKTAFWNAFHRDGTNFTEKSRQSAYDWVKLMVRYEKELPSMISKNPESGEFWPENRNPGNPSTVAKKDSHSSEDTSGDVDKGSFIRPSSWDTAMEDY